ncbi:hypothetical protein [Aestuariimicrobium sp. Y1814]|uniref:hypothetical protein n=1 Tax=Aestuariimicrobium sp. Y1814 TaxID=3418742 RepID=UPI003DA6DA82
MTAAELGLRGHRGFELTSASISEDLDATRLSGMSRKIWQEIALLPQNRGQVSPPS